MHKVICSMFIETCSESILQPQDIYQSTQHNLIKDLTNHGPDLRSRFFWPGPPPIPLRPLLPIATTVAITLFPLKALIGPFKGNATCYHRGHGGLPTWHIEGVILAHFKHSVLGLWPLFTYPRREAFMHLASSLIVAITWH